MLTEITLPFPPSVNHYWRHVVIGRSARTMISEKGREYARAVWVRWHAQIIGPPKPMSGNLAVSIHLYPPTKQKRDADNYNKALLDALTKAGAWEDDNQIKHLQIWMHESVGKADARAVVTIEDIEETKP